MSPPCPELAYVLLTSPSTDEAQASLRLLCELCPEFVYVKTLDRQDWLCVKADPAYGLKEVKERVRVEREKAQLGQAL